jgi:hypothetical protein
MNQILKDQARDMKVEETLAKIYLVGKETLQIKRMVLTILMLKEIDSIRKMNEYHMLLKMVSLSFDFNINIVH